MCPHRVPTRPREPGRAHRQSGALRCDDPHCPLRAPSGSSGDPGPRPMTWGDGLRTVQVWDDGHVHFFIARGPEWPAHNAGFSEVPTEALIDIGGCGSRLRRVRDLICGHELVKGFPSGNARLVARK